MKKLRISQEDAKDIQLPVFLFDLQEKVSLKSSKKPPLQLNLGLRNVYSSRNNSKLV